MVDGIFNDVDLSGRLGGKVTVQWIPSHVNVDGNEKADSLAKTGAAQPQPDVPVTYLGAKTWLMDHFRNQWDQEWANNTTARGVFANMPRPMVEFESQTPEFSDSNANRAQPNQLIFQQARPHQGLELPSLQPNL